MSPIHLELVINLHHRFVVPAPWILVHTTVSDTSLMLRCTPATAAMYSCHIQLAHAWQQLAPRILHRCVSAVSFILPRTKVLTESAVLSRKSLFVSIQTRNSVGTLFTCSLHAQWTWLWSCLDSGRILGWLFIELSSQDLQSGRLFDLVSTRTLLTSTCYSVNTSCCSWDNSIISCCRASCAALTSTDLHQWSDVTENHGFWQFLLAPLPWRHAPFLVFPRISRCKHPLVVLILGYHHLFRSSTLWIHCWCSGLDERLRLWSHWWWDSRYVWKHHGCTWPLAADHGLHSHFYDDEPASFFYSCQAGKRGRKDVQLLTDTPRCKECTWLAPSRDKQEVTLRKTVADNRDTGYLSACIKLIKIINSVILVNNVQFCHSKKLELLSATPRARNVCWSFHCHSWQPVIKLFNSRLLGTIISVLPASRSPILVNTKPMHPKDNWKMRNELQHLPEQFNLPRSSQSVAGLEHCVYDLLLVHVGQSNHQELWNSRVLCSDEVGDVLDPSSVKGALACSGSVTAVVRNSAPLPCSGDSRIVAHLPRWG